MEVRYYLDPESGEPHIHEHGVTEEEVEAVLLRPGEDLPAKNGARQALGQTAAGRFLRVIYVPDPDPNSVFVITHLSCAVNHCRLFAAVGGGEEDERATIPAGMGR
jgi:hypothetical protein